MKISINLKDPDGVYDSLYSKEAGVPDDIREEIINKYFPHSEYLSLVYDTETKTLTPVQRNR